MEKQTVQFQFGGQDVTLETGAIARQATGAVLISMGETQILATVVGAKNVKPGQSFFLSQFITKKRHMLRVKSQAVTSSVKVVQQRKKR